LDANSAIRVRSGLLASAGFSKMLISKDNFFTMTTSDYLDCIRIKYSSQNKLLTQPDVSSNMWDPSDPSGQLLSITRVQRAALPSANLERSRGSTYTVTADGVHYYY
jgi:hypothetical protein